MKRNRTTFFLARFLSIVAVLFAWHAADADDDFTGAFNIDDWDFVTGGTPSFVDANTFTITLGGPDTGSETGSTTFFTIQVPDSYLLSFDWTYSTNDGPTYDWVGYLANGSSVRLSDNSGNFQSGSESNIDFMGGEFGFYVASLDNTYGPATLTISNFKFTIGTPVYPTWSGAANSNWTNAGNWSTSVPNGASQSAVFGASSQTAVTINTDVSLRALRFEESASAYTLTVQNQANRSLNLYGEGIQNESAVQQKIINRQVMYFRGSATVEGDVLIQNTGSSSLFRLWDNASLGSATVESTNGATLSFWGSSSAGDATISLNSAGNGFSQDSTAANATINVTGPVGAIIFENSASAGNAEINLIDGGAAYFISTPTADGATVNLDSGDFRRSVVDFSGLTQNIAIGAIDGDGDVYLGSVEVTIGGLDTSTEIDGEVADGGFDGGSGGGLNKVGTGTLTLLSNNSYTGATTVSEGILRVDGSIAASSGVLVRDGATLSGNGTVSTVTLEDGGILAPGASAGLLTIGGDLYTCSCTLIYLELGRAELGEYDSLDILGYLEAGGTLEVVLLNDFDPEEGDTFDLFDFASVGGAFETVLLPTLALGFSWDTSKLYETGEISVIAVPEPGVAALAIFGVIGVLAGHRRRKG